MPLLSRTTATPGEERDHAFDVIRLVAAVAVIVVHSPGLDRVPDWSLPLRFAVPFFCCTAAHFAFLQYRKRVPPDSLRSYADERFERVYRPFVAWSLVYAVTQLLAYWFGLADTEPKIGPELFLFGTAAHLWFIPFILAAGIAVYACMPVIARRPAAGGAVAAAIGVALALWQCWSPGRPEDLPLPIQLVARSTSIFAGTAIASWVLGLAVSRRARLAIAVAGLCFGVTGSWCAVTMGGSRVMWGTSIGVSVYCLCLGGMRWPALRPLSSLGPYSLGVYFAHYAFVEGYEDIGKKVFGLSVTPGTNALLIAASIVSAIVAVWVLSRFEPTRRLVR